MQGAHQLKSRRNHAETDAQLEDVVDDIIRKGPAPMSLHTHAEITEHKRIKWTEGWAGGLFSCQNYPVPAQNPALGLFGVSCSRREPGPQNDNHGGLFAPFPTCEGQSRRHGRVHHLVGDDSAEPTLQQMQKSRSGAVPLYQCVTRLFLAFFTAVSIWS